MREITCMSAMAVLILACRPLPASKTSEQRSAIIAAEHAEIRANSQRRFAAARFAKPHDDAGFAPLFVWESPPAVAATNDLGQRWVATVTQRTAQSKGWFASVSRWSWEGDGPDGPTGEILIWQDDEGFATVVEAAISPQGHRKIFVAQSLELAANARFGPPLPYRAFSIEPSLAVDSNLLVAGVFDDGPVPMGPYIYLDQSGLPTTILCRCSPSQVDEIRQSQYYELVHAPWPAGVSPPSPPQLRYALP